MAVKYNNKGKGVQTFWCKCGGQIEMFMTSGLNKKIKTIARCNKCGKEKRRPSDFPGMITKG